jgi:hypothetical protein
MFTDKENPLTKMLGYRFENDSVEGFLTCGFSKDKFAYERLITYIENACTRKEETFDIDRVISEKEQVNEMEWEILKYNWEFTHISEIDLIELKAKFQLYQIKKQDSIWYGKMQERYLIFNSEGRMSYAEKEKRRIDKFEKDLWIKIKSMSFLEVINHPQMR